MSNFLIGLLAVAVSVEQPSTASYPVKQKTGSAGNLKRAADQDDPVEKDYLKLLEMDDAAQDEVDKWIKDAKAFREKGAGLPEGALSSKIDQRFAEVRRAYENFLQLHPKHTRAWLAYGSFLNDIREEDEAVARWEKARELDPTNPAAWNNLANYYGHRSPVRKAFEYYGKAIELAPDEPVYLQNLATTVYLFRHDAKEYYGVTEEQVFDKALGLYRKALKLDPKNFVLAQDLAQSYYGIKPLRTKDAIEAWEYALKVANDDIEREGVYLHMARVELNSGQFNEARRHIDLVKNQMYDGLKERLARNLKEKETSARNGSANPPVTAGKSTVAVEQGETPIPKSATKQ